MRRLFFCAVVLPLAAAVDPLVHVTYAHYLGTSLGNGITQWLGLRYAAAPVGDLRFAAPQDPPEVSTTHIADTFGDICLGTGAAPSKSSSEDCLFLNVFAPSHATRDSKLPVYFFIQGGGFNKNSNPNLNGSGLIKASGHNIIVVQINYRVGPYGFLASAEVLDGGSVNNGLKDQMKALKWVQENIEQFGGDPGHVVVGGDSAGAASINLLLTAYGGRDDGLFHATAAESQTFAAIRTVEESQFAYDSLVIRTNCVSSYDTLSCLRSLNASYLQTKNFNTPFPGGQNPPLYMYGPTLDHDFVKEYTHAAYANGNFIKLPAIYGDDTNEGTIFTPKSTNTIGESDTFLKDQYPTLTLEQLKKINEVYPVAEQFDGTGKYWRQVSNAYGEIRYICPGIFISNVYDKMDLISSWNYHWNVIDPTANASGTGVSHTVEVNAIWGPENVNESGPASYNTTNAAIVPIVQAYWTSFIRSYDPNTHRLPGTPVWETWTLNAYRRLLFQTNDTKMETVPRDQRERCDYLASIQLDLTQ